MLWFRYVKGLEEGELLCRGGDKPRDRFALDCGNHGSLEGKLLQYPLGGAFDLGLLEPVAHEALDHQGHDTDEDMGLDPAVNPVIDGSDIEGAFEGAEALLNFLEFLVLMDNLGGAQA